MKTSPEYYNQTVQSYRNSLMGEIVSCHPLHQVNWQAVARLLLDSMDSEGVAKALEAMRKMPKGEL